MLRFHPFPHGYFRVAQHSASQLQTAGSVLKDLRPRQERLPTEPKILRSAPKDWGREPKR